MSSGLANALDALADAQDAAPAAPAKRPTRSKPKPQPQPQSADVITGEIDDESGEVGGSAPYAAGASSHKQRPRGGSSPRRKRKKSNDGLKQIAAPVLMTTGLLLLIPAVWSVLILSGALVSEREGARNMALAMLVAWPMALILLAGGGFFVWQVINDKKQAAQEI